MIFYTVDTGYNKYFKEHYRDHIMCLEYDYYTDMYTVVAEEYINCNRRNDFRYIILHSLSDEDVVMLKLQGIPLIEMYYQDLLKDLYINKCVRISVNVYKTLS